MPEFRALRWRVGWVRRQKRFVGGWAAWCGESSLRKVPQKGWFIRLREEVGGGVVPGCCGYAEFAGWSRRFGFEGVIIPATSSGWRRG